jgi:hypothetical protein
MDWVFYFGGALLGFLAGWNARRLRDFLHNASRG